MTDFDASEEPADLPAVGRGRISDSAGIVGVIEQRPTVAARVRVADSGGRRTPVPGGAGVRLRGAPAAMLRYLDVALVLLAAPVALSHGAPAVGYGIGAGAWIAQRVLAQADRRWIGRTRAPRTQLGLNLFEAFGRIWLLAGAIVAAALIGGRTDGLTASLVIFAAYTVAFATRVITGPPQGRAAA